MFQSLNRSNVHEYYEIIDDKTLSFKDRVLLLYGNEVNSINQLASIDLDDKYISGFKNTIDEIIRKQSKVLIVSDYDCDGICALVIMLRMFEYLKVKVNYYIPSREKEGYGISAKIVKMAKDYRFDMIITLDNGIVALEAIELANQYNIDMMIIDHHKFSELPNVKTIIHPDLLDEYHHAMCTGGLMYVLSRSFYHDDYSLVLAMMATMGDVCEVKNANRYILTEGLKAINKDIAQTYPIMKLMKKNGPYTYDDISFNIIPKINAISRMDHMTNVNIIPKFLNDFDHHNLNTLNQIEEINQLRKAISNECANRLASRQFDDDLVLIYEEDLIEGLCGLIANNLVNKIKKPVIVLTKSNGLIKGSARSIDGFDLHACLKAYHDFFVSFGGHKKAVGLSLQEEKLDSFKEMIKNTRVDVEVEKTKCVLISEDDLTFENLDFIKSLEPFGEGLNEPLLYLDNPKIIYKFMIKNLYPKYTLSSKVEAISFDSNMNYDDIKAMIGHAKIQFYNNKAKINFSIKQIVI